MFFLNFMEVFFSFIFSLELEPFIADFGFLDLLVFIELVILVLNIFFFFFEIRISRNWSVEGRSTYWVRVRPGHPSSQR